MKPAYPDSSTLYGGSLHTEMKDKFAIKQRPSTFSTRRPTQLNSFSSIKCKAAALLQTQLSAQQQQQQQRQPVCVLAVPNDYFIFHILSAFWRQKSGEDKSESLFSESLSACHWIHWATKPVAPFSWDLINSHSHRLRWHHTKIVA